jgi:hypothetical protein
LVTRRNANARLQNVRSVTGSIMPENPAFSESASESWQQLAINVETQARALRGLAEGTPLAAQAADLARDAGHLASQIERLAAAAPAFLTHLGQPESPESPEPPATDPKLEAEIHREMLQIQRETHDGNVELMDIVKALFMWRDDPAERVRERKLGE